MTLSDLAALGSFVSGVAVLASLAFLFFQMRQMSRQVRQTEQQLKLAEKHQQAAIRQGRAAIVIDWNLRMAESPGKMLETSWRLIDGEPVTDILELRRLQTIAFAMFQLYQEEFDQYREGVLNAAAFESVREAIRRDMRQAGLRVAWKLYRAGIGDRPFAAFVDQIVAETTPLAPDNLLSVERWNNLIALERAHHGARSTTDLLKP